jgi:hypothetical protein
MEKEDLDISPQKPLATLPPLTKDKTGKSVKVRKKKLEKIRMDNNATAIQKIWRGNQGRKQIREREKNQISSPPIQSSVCQEQKEEEEDKEQARNNQSEEKDEPENDINSPLNESSPTPRISPPKAETRGDKSEGSSTRDLDTTPKSPGSHSQPQTQDPPPVPVWPATSHDDFNILETFGSWPDLESSDDLAHRGWVIKNQKLLARAVTWNMCANDPPAKEEVQKVLLPLNKSVYRLFCSPSPHCCCRFHILVVGTEECERSIAKSAVNPSKKGWEAYLTEAVGSNYVPVRSHTLQVCLSLPPPSPAYEDLQAIHLMLFVHKAIRPLISDVTSAAVACGMANTLGNKGGVGISFCLGSTRIVVINSHLEAHQNKTKTRNHQFHKICSEMPQLLRQKMPTKEKKDDSSPATVLPAVPQVKVGSGGAGEDGGQDDEDEEGGDEKLDDDGYRKKSDQLNQYGDRVIFMGDMNYRINGNRFARLSD